MLSCTTALQVLPLKSHVRNDPSHVRNDPHAQTPHGRARLAVRRPQ